MAATKRLSTGFVVFFETKKLGHRILGQIDGEYPVVVYRKVIDILVKSGLKEEDILPLSTKGYIELVGGTKIYIYPLAQFEDYAHLVAHYMEHGTLVDLEPDQYSRISGALAES